MNTVKPPRQSEKKEPIIIAWWEVGPFGGVAESEGHAYALATSWRAVRALQARQQERGLR